MGKANGETTFTIGALADELAITTRTIRYYEERGLLTPARSEGNQRIYTRRDRGRLKLLLRAKGLGFRLDDIKRLFEIYDLHPNDVGEQRQFRTLQTMIDERLAQIEAQMVALQQLRGELRRRRDEVATRLRDYPEPAA